MCTPRKKNTGKNSSNNSWHTTRHFRHQQLPNPTNLPDTFPDCIGDRCFARTSTTGNGNNKNWFIKETLGWRAWFAISTFNKRSHWTVRDVCGFGGFSGLVDDKKVEARRLPPLQTFIFSVPRYRHIARPYRHTQPQWKREKTTSTTTITQPTRPTSNCPAKNVVPHKWRPLCWIKSPKRWVFSTKTI